MKTVTCFSFKGGAGRTVAAANIAAAMASDKVAGSIQAPMNKRTALLDLDVFAAGTHRVFEIGNEDLSSRPGAKSLQDYLTEEISPRDFVDKHKITMQDSLMEHFPGRDYCRDDFTLFPSRPDPNSKFVVQKYHENLLLELLQELQEREYDYVFIDGESGSRSMADIAFRIADEVLMLFRLTWQHIEGTLAAAEDRFQKVKQKKERHVPFFLLPSCVAMVDGESSVYRRDAPGFDELRDSVREMPSRSRLSEFVRRHKWELDEGGKPKDGVPGPGYLIDQGRAIHESLFLAGEEQVIVFGHTFMSDRAAQDFCGLALALEDRCNG